MDVEGKNLYHVYFLHPCILDIWKFLYIWEQIKSVFVECFYVKILKSQNVKNNIDTSDIVAQ